MSDQNQLSDTNTPSLVREPKFSDLKTYFNKYKKTIPLFKITLIVFVIFSLGVFSSYLYFRNYQSKNVLSAEKDAYVSFLAEIYDQIKANYWDKTTDEQLANLYRLGAEKLLKSPQDLNINNKKGILNMVSQIMKNMKPAQKKEFTANLANIVLANLNPFGRSGLYTTKDEENLKNKVQNKDPNANLYKDLGVKKDASQTDIKGAYSKESEKLNQVLQDKNQPQEVKQEAQKQLAQVNRAYEALKTPEDRKSYDTTGAEPTVSSKALRSDIFYIKIKQLSPATFEEFQRIANSTENNKNLNTLVLDLRGNIGGAIDILPYFLGPFIGQNQYAYDFFHQGNYEPFKTKIGWLTSLIKFKKVIVLTDGQTQSSAEVMAATFKKYNTGIVLGTKTRGWGTVEKVFPIKQQIDAGEKYSMFLVHSLTLREDGQPIEGKGVDPTINIQDADWENQLYTYYHYDSLTQAVKEVLNPSTN